MSQTFDWTTEPLSAEDQKLVDAYRTIGRSLDDLPYTADFEKLRVAVGADDDDIDSRNETPANVRQPDIRKLRAENVGR